MKTNEIDCIVVSSTTCTYTMYAGVHAGTYLSEKVTERNEGRKALRRKKKQSSQGQAIENEDGKGPKGPRMEGE